MAPRTRGGASPTKLRFNDKLVGKGLATDALLKKLKALHTELAEFDQEHVDVASLNTVRKELISTSILLHKDKGVKAYAACCLADLLRLYAPDAPYTANELRDIFQFFFRQLSTGLKGSDAPYYNEYFHLLESLSTVKSVVLVCDLPNAEELMAEIFRDFFGLVRQDLAKNIEIFMADILAALIEECQVVSADVLEAIMAQFLDKNARMEQPAYRLAVEVCNSSANKLQRHVCQYFTDVIVQHSRDEEFDEIQAAHDLIKQLNHSCPSLLHNVVPQLEEELRVEEVQLRLMATQVLGQMFGDLKGGPDLVKKYPNTWSTWLARKNDKASTVRLAWVESIHGLLVHPSDFQSVIEDSLEQKLLDPDEKVRAAVCGTYAQLDYETALHRVSERMLRSIAGRALDKKQHVRQEAIRCLGKLFALAYPEIESGDVAAIRQFAWIPQLILPASRLSWEIRALVEQFFFEDVIPLPKKGEEDEAALTERVLTVMSFLDEKSLDTLIGLTGLKSPRPSPLEVYLQACITNNGGVIDEDEENVVRKLNFTVQRASVQFPDPVKAVEDLQTFAKNNENRLYQLLKTCVDRQTDLKGLVKAMNEFLRRLKDSAPAIAPTMIILLRRASLLLINQSSIPTLIKRVQKGATGRGDALVQSTITVKNSTLLLSTISKHCPALYKPHTAELMKATTDDANVTLVETALQALSALARSEDKVFPHDKRLLERATKYIEESNHRHSKFAARIIAYSRDRDTMSAKAVSTLADALPNADEDELVANLAALAEFASASPDAFEQKSDVITAFLLKQVLMVPSPQDEDAMNADNEWVGDDEVPPKLRAKVFGIKICRNRCLAHGSSDNAIEIATPVIRMLDTLIQHLGSFSEDAVDDPTFKSRLRLIAATSLFQLSAVEKLAPLTTPNFVSLSLMMQDSCYEVRDRFLTKLLALLARDKLNARFNVIPFLTAHEPEQDLKEKAKGYVLGTFRKFPQALRMEKFEMIFLRLLHILAHHPDFAMTPESLQDQSKYIDFYLDCIASADNISFLYHLSMKVKGIRDAESHTFSENLYVSGELAQELIKARAKIRGWSLDSYPGKVKLPADIFRPLPTVEAAQKIQKTVYLPEETLKWLGEMGKAARPAGIPKDKTKAPRRPAVKRKATSSKANGFAKRRRKRRTDDDDDDDNDNDMDEDDDDEGGGSSAPEDIDSDNDDGVNGHDRGKRMRTSSPAPPGTEDEDEGEGEEGSAGEKLGRGARSKAKAKAQREARRAARAKAT